MEKIFYGMALWLAMSNATNAAVRVVATTPALADIVRHIGGKHVQVDSIMRGPENVHNVVAKPSYMMKLRRASLLVHSGLDGEPWVPNLIKGARSQKLLPGQPGNVNASVGIALKEVPTRGGLTRALGDIHVFGNPHYLLDPLNGIIVGRTVRDALKRTDPKHASDFDRGYKGFTDRVRVMTETLIEKMKPFVGVKVVTFHRSWPYFLDRFGLVSIGEVEPKPGITPGPQHLQACVDRMLAEKVKVVIVETFNSKKQADFVAEKAGGMSVVLPSEVLGVPECDDYFKLFQYNVNTLIDAFHRVGVLAN